MLCRVIWPCYIMFKPPQHPTLNMVYNMLYDIFERFAPALSSNSILLGVQSWAKYLDTFLRFSIISFHHK